MQLIKGIDLKLFNENGFEIVKNVLVGEPTIIDSEVGNMKILTYTIAVPKGDFHDWTDKKIEFFGKIFRTGGYEIQGISENIPLPWHKKIQAHLLVINGDFTLYNGKNYTRYVYHDVLISDSRDSGKNKLGELKKGSLDIQIYSVNNPGFSHIPQAGDIIVKGICPLEFEISDEQRISENMRILRDNFPDFAVVNTCEKKFLSAKPDLIISAR